MNNIRNTLAEIKPNKIDAYVGKRVRMQRTILGLSQVELSERVGLTFQQIQKYEQGDNRIGSSRLYDLSQALSVPITFFFEDFEQAALKEDNLRVKKDPAARRETLELVRAFNKIKDNEVKTAILELIAELSQEVP
ncbi:MAG: helix-turn-helix transcriptional regulator [Sneathiella sp.]|nr:helix-turn-helix transcriptional regulator [Sneathiella sp.]